MANGLAGLAAGCDEAIFDTLERKAKLKVRVSD